MLNHPVWIELYFLLLVTYCTVFIHECSYCIKVLMRTQNVQIIPVYTIVKNVWAL